MGPTAMTQGDEMHTAIRTADLADMLAAGMDFPQRDALRPASHASAAALFRARRAFWLAAATTYLAQAEAGIIDALHDAREALAQSEAYAPRAD